jgi:hypothetical protein
MTPDSTRSPFVAKAHFLTENKWLNRYEKFWFQSEMYAPKGANHEQQFRSLKEYIDKAVINKTHELVIFDNRKTFVSNWSAPEKNGVNIVCRYVNGQLIDDNFYRLSFLDWTFDPSFLHKLARSFQVIGGPTELQPAGETELIREKIHFQKWDDAVTRYKQFMQTVSR